MNKTLGERLRHIEKREKVSGLELAKKLGIDPKNYYSKKYRLSDRPPTVWQRIALRFIDIYGLTDILPL